MEKYNEADLLKEIKSSVYEGDYATALRLSQDLDLNRIKSISALCLLGEILIHEKQYDKAEKLMLRAYDKSPKGRRILDLLTSLYIEKGSYAEAEYYYKEFISVASRDLHRYSLRYRLDRGKGERTAVLIHTLEQLKDYEYIEEWAYELARLYHEAGDDKKSIRECDDIVLWFGHGDYVLKALKLKEEITGEKQYIEPEPEDALDPSATKIWNASELSDQIAESEKEEASEENVIPEESSERLQLQEEFNDQPDTEIWSEKTEAEAEIEVDEMSEEAEAETEVDEASEEEPKETEVETEVDEMPEEAEAETEVDETSEEEAEEAEVKTEVDEASKEEPEEAEAETEVDESSEEEPEEAEAETEVDEASEEESEEAEAETEVDEASEEEPEEAEVKTEVDESSEEAEAETEVDEASEEESEEAEAETEVDEASEETEVETEVDETLEEVDVENDISSDEDEVEIETDEPAESDTEDENFGDQVENNLSNDQKTLNRTNRISSAAMFRMMNKSDMTEIKINNKQDQIERLAKAFETTPLPTAESIKEESEVIQGSDDFDILEEDLEFGEDDAFSELEEEEDIEEFEEEKYDNEAEQRSIIENMTAILSGQDDEEISTEKDEVEAALDDRQGESGTETDEAFIVRMKEHLAKKSASIEPTGRDDFGDILHEVTTQKIAESEKRRQILESEPDTTDDEIDEIVNEFSDNLFELFGEFESAEKNEQDSLRDNEEAEKETEEPDEDVEETEDESETEEEAEEPDEVVEELEDESETEKETEESDEVVEETEDESETEEEAEEPDEVVEELEDESETEEEAQESDEVVEELEDESETEKEAQEPDEVVEELEDESETEEETEEPDEDVEETEDESETEEEAQEPDEVVEELEDEPETEDSDNDDIEYGNIDFKDMDLFAEPKEASDEIEDTIDEEYNDEDEDIEYGTAEFSDDDLFVDSVSEAEEMFDVKEVFDQGEKEEDGADISDKIESVMEKIGTDMQENQVDIEAVEAEDDEIINEMPEAVLDIFSTAADISDVKKQLAATFTKLESSILEKTDILASYEINFVVSGKDESMKSQIAIGIAKALNTYGMCDKNKIVRATAEELNNMDFSPVFKKIDGGCLIIVKAGMMSDTSIETLSAYIEQEGQKVAIILEDTEDNMLDLWQRYPKLRGRFLNVINIAKYDEMELVRLAQSYAKKNGYDISEEARMVTLRDIFAERMANDQDVNYEDIIAIIDEAVVNLEKRNMKNLFMTVLDNAYKEASMFTLLPEDFR